MRLINAEHYAEKIREYANVLRDENPTSIVAIMAAMSYDIAADEAMKEPSIDAVPIRHGEWVKETDRENHWHCSECGVVVGIVAEYAPYCYKCGAKMDDDEHDDR